MKHINTIIYISLLYQCTTTSQIPNLREESNIIALKSETILPEKFIQNIEESQYIIAPPNTLKFSFVKNDDATLTEGPGSEFKSISFVDKGEKLLLLEITDLWHEVYSFKKQVRGWIHFNHLTKAQWITQSTKIQSNILPAVFPIRLVHSILDFKNMKKKHVRIDKGTPFKKLSTHKGMALIWIQETRSLAWLEKDSYY
jgi:hypothetical protein